MLVASLKSLCQFTNTELSNFNDVNNEIKLGEIFQRYRNVKDKI